MDGRDGTGEIEGSTRGPRGPKKKGNRRFKDLESITSYFHTCRGTGRAAQQDGSDGGG